MFYITDLNHQAFIKINYIFLFVFLMLFGFLFGKICVKVDKGYSTPTPNCFYTYIIFKKCHMAHLLSISTILPLYFLIYTCNKAKDNEFSKSFFGPSNGICRVLFSKIKPFIYTCNKAKDNEFSKSFFGPSNGICRVLFSKTKPFNIYI